MTEIKPNNTASNGILTKIRCFISVHLIGIGMLILFIVFTLAGCQKAKAAESLPDNLVSVMESDIDDIYPSVYDYFINNLSLVADYTNVVRFVDYNNRGFAYYFFKSNVVGLANNYGVTRGLLNTQSFYYTYYPILLDGGQVSASSLDCYMFICWNGMYSITHAVRSGSVYNVSQYVNMPFYNVDYGICNGISQSISQYSTENIYMVDTNAGSITYSYINGNSHSLNYYQGDFKSTNILSNCDFCFCDKNNYTLAVYTYDDWAEIYPSAVEDNRLRIYTINDNTGKDIVFDLDDFDFSNYDGSEAATQNTLVDNQIIVTVDYDGTEQTFTLDSTNSDILPAYLIETPLSYFNIDSYTNVKITKVQFSKLIHYRPSEMREDETETYNIACEYYLKRYVEPIEKGENEYADEVDGNKLTQIRIDDLTGKINFSDGYYSPLGGGGNELVVPYGYNVLYVTITGSRTIASIINEIIDNNYLEIMTVSGVMTSAELGIYLAQEITSSITGITSTADAEALIKDMVKNNYYTNMFDIVVYYWAPDSSLGEVDVMYYYLTESGRLRGISQTLADLYVDTNEIKVNTAAIWKTIDNIEDESLAFFNAQLDFDDDALEWFKTINNSINKLDIPVFDDSDILLGISDVVTAIGNITFPATDMSTTNELLARINSVLGGQDLDEELIETPYALEVMYDYLRMLNGESDTMVYFVNSEPTSPVEGEHYIVIDSVWWATTFNSITLAFSAITDSIPETDIAGYVLSLHDALLGQQILTVPDYANGYDTKDVTYFTRMFSRIFDYDFDPSYYWGEMVVENE